MAGVGGYMYNVCSVCLEAFKGLSKSKAIGIEILMSSIKAWRGLKDAAGVWCLNEMFQTPLNTSPEHIS